MKKFIALTLAAGLALGSLAGVQAKLPAAPPKSDADKAVEAEKAAAAKAKEGAENAKAQDKAVANYKKNKGMAEPKTSAATTSGKKK
ncbi:MAG: hypothetical protein EXR33_08605 [Betaproteobacteria bacterium]|nr:hypothetical protein [Betaproteobacteria bacterium]